MKKNKFPMVDAYMKLRNMDIKNLAIYVGCTQQTMYNKLLGKTEFTLKDMLAIRAILKSNITLDMLFTKG